MVTAYIYRIFDACGCLHIYISRTVIRRVRMTFISYVPFLLKYRATPNSCTRHNFVLKKVCLTYSFGKIYFSYDTQPSVAHCDVPVLKMSLHAAILSRQYFIDLCVVKAILKRYIEHITNTMFGYWTHTFLEFSKPSTVYENVHLLRWRWQVCYLQSWNSIQIPLR